VSQSIGGWCGDFTHYLSGSCQTAKLVSSLDPSLCTQNDTQRFVKYPCNLPQVNYLLNARLDPTYKCKTYKQSQITWLEWQRAIWWLVDGNTTCDCGAPGYNNLIANCLYADANKNSNWKVTSCTDVFAVILVPLPGCTCNVSYIPTDAESTYQELIIPMSLSQWGCPCVAQTSTETPMAFSGVCPNKTRPDTDISADGKNCLLPNSSWQPYFEYCCAPVAV